jgi:hypothetical protein
MVSVGSSIESMLAFWEVKATSYRYPPVMSS